MKRYISIIVIMCFLFGLILPTMIFGYAYRAKQQEINLADFSDSEDVNINEIESSSELEKSGADPGSENTEGNDTEPEETEEGGVEFEEAEEGHTESGEAEEDDTGLEEAEEGGGKSEETEETDNESEETEEDGKESGEPEKNDYDIENPELDYDDANYEEVVFIYVIVDEKRNVTLISWPLLKYEVVDEYGEDDIIIMLKPYDCEIEITKISEDNISFDLPLGWTYKIEIDNYTITITPFVEEIRIFENPEIHINVDNNHRVTVIATEGIEYQVIHEDVAGTITLSAAIGENISENENIGGNIDIIETENYGNIIVMLKPEYLEIEIAEEDISVSLPDEWVYEIDPDSNTITITPLFSVRSAPLFAAFTQDEIDNPLIWYAVPDRVIALAPTPAGTVYDRLLTAIRSAAPNQITHILIPVHINTGGIGLNGSVVRIPNGATVVLIGDHPTAANGQIVLSDTHGTSNVSRPLRVRGDGTERNALVVRNIIIQNSGGVAQGSPANPPAPMALASQTGASRGGGVAIEAPAADPGGGHFILCRDGVLRNNTTDNNGAVDVQTNSRFTMMPGSLMHTNAAGNSGGAVHVGTNAVFNMHGGIIRDNLARGENLNSPLMRAVGGAVFVQNGGTFNMHNGEIFGNSASLSTISAAPTATNGLVTSSGGGVFVTGAASSFNMYGGTIRNNNATHTRASNVGTAPNRALFRSGNGGGVYVTDGAAFTMRGGHIHSNIATSSGTAASSATGGNALNLSNGGGVYLTGANTTFNMLGGEIHNNEAVRTVNSAPTMAAGTAIHVLAGNGGGVHVSNGAIFNMSAGEIFENTAGAVGGNPTNDLNNIAVLANGGGVFVTGIQTVSLPTAVNNPGNPLNLPSRFNMSGGTISNSHTVAGTVANASSVTRFGGGVFLYNRVSFDMTGGTIRNNTADDAGGLYVFHANLGNVNIAPEAVFTGNRARNGVSIEDGVGMANRGRIRPGTTSLSWTGEFIHPFTNYDINASGTQLQQVTYETGSGRGNVSAIISGTDVPVSSGDFVVGGTRVIFSADPARKFEWWDVGIRPVTDVPFVFDDGGTDPALDRIINTHTHVIGHFGEIFTSLTVSKTVEGALGNLSKEFDFTIAFKGPDGSTPLKNLAFNYVGGIIDGSGATAPPNGVLTLDSDGNAAFKLRHGQVIVIEGVPLESYIQIVETPDVNYTVSFRDSGDEDNVVIGNDTTLLAMTENRVFGFINKRNNAPPMGVVLGDVGGIMLLTGLVSLSALIMFGISIVFRCFKLPLPKLCKVGCDHSWHRFRR